MAFALKAPSINLASFRRKQAAGVMVGFDGLMWFGSRRVLDFRRDADFVTREHGIEIE